MFGPLTHSTPGRPREDPVNDIPVQRTKSPRPRPAEADLGFGRHFTDHLFRADWSEGRGWHGSRVVPYGDLALDPATSVLHYGQSVFEGLKAFPRPGGGLSLFRPRAHAERFARSAVRLAMPPVDPGLLLDGVRALLCEDASWMPEAKGTAIYVRPVMFAVEPFLGVRAAHAYAVVVFLSPVGGYFTGERPLRLWVERERARAARGGIGAAKASANYVASLLPAEEAKARGFDQVLWLDAAERRWLEEIGTMNVFVRLGDALVTPPLTGTILAGITRDSAMALARERGVTVEERPISLEELAGAHRDGRLGEVFGTGTAAVVSPIGEVAWEGTSLRLPAPEDGLGMRLRAELTAIQRGEATDRHGWVERA
jgi:branched-chain amino acid aminotransferase